MSEDLLLRARGEAVQEVTAAMLLAAGEAMLRHGNDPKGHMILTAATVMFIDKINRGITPDFRAAVAAMLGAPIL